MIRILFNSSEELKGDYFLKYIIQNYIFGIGFATVDQNKTVLDPLFYIMLYHFD